MKYRKKPVVIEAFQWIGNVLQADYPDWIGKAIDRRIAWKDPVDMSCLIIHTLEGDHRANAGDYIIKGVQGELYPCKPDIFEATYEEVKDDEMT